MWKKAEVIPLVSFILKRCKKDRNYISSNKIATVQWLLIDERNKDFERDKNDSFIKGRNYCP